MIYLDNGATTFPKPEVVYQAMDIFARTGAVNAGRGAYAAARAADQMIKNVRTGLSASWMPGNRHRWCSPHR